MPTALIEANTFGDYCQASHLKIRPELLKGEDERDLLLRATALGNEIIKAVKAGEIKDFGAAKLLLDSLGAIAEGPSRNENVLDREFFFVQDQFRNLTGRRAQGKTSAA